MESKINWYREMEKVNKHKLKNYIVSEYTHKVSNINKLFNNLQNIVQRLQ